MFSLFKKANETEEERREPRQFGPYYLQELINSGGMADIWLATDSKGKASAIRLLHHNLRYNLAAKRRFVRGCETLAKIPKHEYVIGYEGHGKIDGDLYLLMEYVEGENLKLLYARSDPVLADNIANVLVDMALALEHVHESGFMHLDFKPENVLLTRNASLRLVDFDLAQPRPEQPKKMSDNPGTPAYMAPEQIRRQPIDHRVDIFAYGVSAYELLTNRKPFPGDTPEEILRRQLDRGLDFVAPRELNPDVPAALEKSILKCIERDPDKRYPYMSVLVRDLKSALYV
ncbi:MAG TPA: serine/threonine-protein kinase [Candidatus Nitrosotalea sp.]|nr:serine/threonine-protein kinase [Candidatus Nitrosotalea sp.]